MSYRLSSSEIAIACIRKIICVCIMYACIGLYMYVRMYATMSVCMYVHVCLHAYMRAFMHVCMLPAISIASLESLTN